LSDDLVVNAMQLIVDMLIDSLQKGFDMNKQLGYSLCLGVASLGNIPLIHIIIHYS